MTVIAVLADPPRPGLVLPELAATSPLSEEDAAELYAAMLQDVFVAVEKSGGDLLVNYRPDDLLPEEHRTDTDAEAEVRALAADALEEVDAARFEVQVGSTFAARAGNTVTYLLEEEAVQSAAVVRGDSPFLVRTAIDSAAMKLRSSEVVLGPSTRGEVYYAGFTEPIDFEDAFATPEIETLTDRGLDAGFEVDFLDVRPTIRTGEDLVSALSLLNAKRQAGRIVPPHTTAMLEELGVRLEVEDGEQRIVRE